MEAERWNKVEELCQAALELPPKNRGAFLAQACPDDAQLRVEVQSLLDQQVGSFLESAPVSTIKALSAGAKLGNFEIVELLGRGGMGEVWRARDARLKREVAIKILPMAFVGDPDRITRFEHEARAASALSHPNIVPVFDIGHEDGKYWIVSELVDGESLRALISRGPLPLRKAAEIATQIAAGLAAAHAAGLVHRDLKPGNIMLHRDGRVGIVDFGLAKRVSAGQDSATLTDAGVVLGTAGYMAPEQVRGETVDQRADLFSFGVVLYEMLSGKQAFTGASSVELMHAILKNDPPDLPASVPPALDGIVRRCLEKEPARRFQSAADLGFALQALSLSPARATPPKKKTSLKWVVLAGAVVAGTALFWLTRPLPPPRVTGMIQITRDGRLTESTVCPLLTDGSRLFFCTSNNMRSYQVSVNGGEPVPLALQAKTFSWVMDISRERTEFLVCHSAKNYACELWAEPIVSGSPRRLGDIVAALDAAWSPDGQQVAYARDNELYLAARDGTEIRKLATFGSAPQFLRWSPDGRRISVSVAGESGPLRLWEVRPEGTGLRQVLPGWNPWWSTYGGVWTTDGKYFVYIANEKIWVVREKEGLIKRRTREPVQLNTGLLAAEHLLPSADGKRLFFEGSQARNEFLRIDKSGKFSLELAGTSGTALEFSKDGKWITYVSVPEGTLFRAAADGSQRFQLTWPPLHVSAPHWSPDGKQIAFLGAPAGERDRIYLVPADGGTPRQISHGEAGKYGDWDPSWSPDSASLAFGATGRDKATDKFIHVLDVKAQRVSTLPGSQGMWAPRWSPDGYSIAGISSFEGRGLVLYDLRTRKQTELYSQGGDFPSWSSDGEFLYFLQYTGWWRVRIRDRKVELVSRSSNFTPAGGGWFVVDPDGSVITSRSTGAGDIYALEWELP